MTQKRPCVGHLPVAHIPVPRRVTADFVRRRMLRVGLASPEILEPRRTQLRIAHCVLNILVAQVRLQRPCVVSFICKGETTGMQHPASELKGNFPMRRRNLR